MEKIADCPICKEKGIKVKGITVRHLVFKELVDSINHVDYFICMNEDCDVVYYSPNQSVSYYKNQVRVPIWFKKDANPKLICYCNKVTEDQIYYAIKNNGAKDIKDIIRLTGAMKECNCEIENPTGKCCSNSIKKIIHKTLNYTKQQFENSFE